MSKLLLGRTFLYLSLYKEAKYKNHEINNIRGNSVYLLSTKNDQRMRFYGSQKAASSILARGMLKEIP